MFSELESPILYNILALVTLSLLLAGLLWIIPNPIEKHQRKAIKYFCGYFLALSISFVCFSIRPWTGLLASVVLTNGFALSAYYCLFLGFSRRFELNLGFRGNFLYWGNLLALLSAQGWFTFFSDNFRIRATLLSCNLSAISLATFFIILKKRSKNNPGEALSLFTTAFCGIAILLLILASPERSSLFVKHDKIILIIFQLVAVGTFGSILTCYLYDLVTRYYNDSIIDALTGIHNRRHFYDHAKDMLSESHNFNFPACLVMCDIDNFKMVNDRFGHDAGDQALLAFAKMLKNNIRHGDLLARYGGEEFVILFPQSNIEQVKPTIERIRKQTNSIKILTKQGVIRYSASFGVSQVLGAAPIDKIIQAADKALYLAKENGRNRIEFGESLGTDPNHHKNQERRDSSADVYLTKNK